MFKQYDKVSSKRQVGTHKMFWKYKKEMVWKGHAKDDGFLSRNRF